MQGVMMQGLSLFRHEKGIRQRIVVPTRPSLGIVTQVLRRAGMQRYQAGFVELRFVNVQLRRIKIELDVASLEAEGFAYPQPGARQEADHGG